MKYEQSLINDKVAKLTQDFGYDDSLAMVEHCICDSVAPAICMNEDCDYSCEYEPDQSQGWCEFCDEGSVVSCLILMGVM